MSVLVCFHAHPDDEAIATGGLMRKAADAGHEVVLVTATRGERGEPKPGVLLEGEELWQRRVEETAVVARILGCVSNEFLGYEDSGMMGEPTNDNPSCFWQADLEEAANRLASILERVGVDVLTIYDDHGLYGHPDHIQVHRVGIRAAQLCGVAHVFESTVSREDAVAAFAEMNMSPDAGDPDDDGLDEDFGMPRARIRYRVPVDGALAAKRAAVRAHASQISEEDFFLAMPDDVFGRIFGHEYYAVPGDSDGSGPVDVDLLPGL